MQTPGGIRVPRGEVVRVLASGEQILYLGGAIVGAGFKRLLSHDANSMSKRRGAGHVRYDRV